MPGSCPETTKIPGAPVRTALPYGFVSMLRLKHEMSCSQVVVWCRIADAVLDA